MGGTSVSGTRRTTLAGRLVRLGFADAAKAERLVTSDLGLDVDPGDRPGAITPPGGSGSPGRDETVLAALAAAADPDLALVGLARIAGAEAGDDAAALRATLRSEPGFRQRLIAVLGSSTALTDHLARHPGDALILRGADGVRRPSPDELRASLVYAVAGNPLDEYPVSDLAALNGTDPSAALTAAYKRHILHLAARDLTGVVTVDQVASELADIAAAAMCAALSVARAQLPSGSAPARLAVIAMGKCGGCELNYSSDVDVIFVAEPPAGPPDRPLSGPPTGAAAAAAEPGPEATDAALRTATRLASNMIKVLSKTTSEGMIFPVDPNLRPEGRNGPLVRTLASHVAYYERWAKTWEFQALLKARPAAGDMRLGQEYMDLVAPMIWQAAQRENFVEDVQAMRRRVEKTLPPDQAPREIKLGPGGLRDIEFAVQLLQLVHGRTDEALRSPSTLPALDALARGGYVGREDAHELAEAYRFLRQVEHLLQLYRLSRTHTLPEDPAVLRRLGRALRSIAASSGQPREPAPPGTNPADEFTELWRRHARQVRRLHEKLFYRPLLGAVARLPGEVARLTPAAAQARLEALGYVDPAGALRHIEALTAGVSRRAAIQRTLLPVLLSWFADAAEPDAGLLAFRQVSDALGDSPWYLRLLRDETKAAERMAHVLASSRYAAGLLLRAPEAVAILGDDTELVPRSPEALRAEADAAVRRHADAEGAAAAVRSLLRRELLRIAAADLIGLIRPAEVADALSAVAAASIEAALAAAARKYEGDKGAPLPTRIAVIGMGRFGGHEMSYGSDADVMFVHDPRPGADEQEAGRAAHSVVQEMRRLLTLPGPDPALVVDANLRPEGRQGPLVRTLASYLAYYRRWSRPWEAQALLRAEPVAGDAELGAEFSAMIDEFRYPDGGIAETGVREVRRLKARMEGERMPRGVDPALHVKLGPGGLSDVEWTIQLLQLRHAFAVARLRTTRTLPALAAAREAGLITAADAATLAEAWQLAARIRDAVMLVRGTAADTIPTAHHEQAAVARILGYGPGEGQALVQDYRRAARRARSVMDRLFYG
ncbi:MAG: bifunctional [glutamine synthetase] adenylyltransferase/[glutamine synthetase]-adenylyl-L-tyrosine phosphorylase [Actinobacteria bacterium]|nr:bifunctional [glutamine synthetase] adenylyltransferase/[glutamine synthetase]-adenylyl-L-tyrosine phosphorylase [Actinomycetota bacterium]